MDKNMEQVLRRNEALEGHVTKQKKIIAHLEGRVIEVDAILQRERDDHVKELARIRATHDQTVSKLRTDHAMHVSALHEQLRKAAIQVKGA